MGWLAGRDVITRTGGEAAQGTSARPVPGTPVRQYATVTGYREVMQTRRAAVVRRIARLLLLFCTLLGLAAMHTIGHDAAGHGTGHGHVRSPPAAATQHVIAMAQVGLSAVVPVVEPVGCAGDGCTPVDLMVHGTSGGMSGWGLCVAVLSSFAIALLLSALLLTRVTGRSRLPDLGGGAARSPRGPPGRALGLSVAAMSVLRM